MNKERMLLLAELLDELKPEQFNIAYWASDYNSDEKRHYCQNDWTDYSAYKCETAACIAGWAVALKNDLEVVDMKLDDIEGVAKDYLELSDYEAQHLFYYSSLSVWEDHCDELGLNSNEDLTSSQAALGLREIVNGNWEL